MEQQRAWGAVRSKPRWCGPAVGLGLIALVVHGAVAAAAADPENGPAMDPAGGQALVQPRGQTQAQLDAALITAARQGLAGEVQRLLDQGAGRRVTGDHPEAIVAAGTQWVAEGMRLDLGQWQPAVIDAAARDRAIDEATTQGHAQALRLLLVESWRRDWVPPQSTRELGHPLLAAAAGGDAERVQQILRGEANLDWNVLACALWLSKQEGQFEVTRLIEPRERAALTAAVYEAWATGLLTKAIEKNDVEQLGRLIETGARVNGRGTDGRTALHMAIERGHAEAAAILVRGGADVSLTDAQGRSVTELARQLGRQAMLTPEAATTRPAP